MNTTQLHDLSANKQNMMYTSNTTQGSEYVSLKCSSPQCKRIALINYICCSNVFFSIEVYYIVLYTIEETKVKVTQVRGQTRSKIGMICFAFNIQQVSYVIHKEFALNSLYLSCYCPNGKIVRILRCKFQ